MNAGCPGFNHRLRQFKNVERTTKTGLGIRNNGRKPINLIPALGVLDLVRALQSLIDPLHHRRDAVGGIQTLIGIHLSSEVRIRGNLPATDVDGFQPCVRLLDGLVAGHGPEGGNIRLGMQQIPKIFRTHARKCVFDPNGTAQPRHVLVAVGASDSLPTVM